MDTPPTRAGRREWIGLAVLALVMLRHQQPTAAEDLEAAPARKGPDS